MFFYVQTSQSLSSADLTFLSRGCLTPPSFAVHLAFSPAIIIGDTELTPHELKCFLKHASRVTPRNIDFQMTLTLQLFSDSVSPAFLIRVGAAMEYSGSGEDEDEEEAKENIYEEIREKSEENPTQADSRKSSTSSHEVSTTSSTGTTKSRFQKALEAVTRRSSRSLEHNNNNSNKNNNNRERSFHLSISKGRKKNLIDRARIDWDCDPQVITTLILKLNFVFLSLSCSS